MSNLQASFSRGQMSSTQKECKKDREGEAQPETLGNECSEPNAGKKIIPIICGMVRSSIASASILTILITPYKHPFFLQKVINPSWQLLKILAERVCWYILCSTLFEE